jgi:hypothetical protein
VVYVLPNELDKDCIGLAAKVDKKCVVYSKRRSAHPVLWICSGLSTAALPFTAFFSRHQLSAARSGRVPTRFTVRTALHPVSLQRPHFVSCQTVHQPIVCSASPGRWPMHIVCQACRQQACLYPRLLHSALPAKPVKRRYDAAFALARTRREPVFHSGARLSI